MPPPAFLVDMVAVKYSPATHCLRGRLRARGSAQHMHMAIHSIRVEGSYMGFSGSWGFLGDGVSLGGAWELPVCVPWGVHGNCNVFA